MTKEGSLGVLDWNKTGTRCTNALDGWLVNVRKCPTRPVTYMWRAKTPKTLHEGYGFATQAEAQRACTTALLALDAAPFPYFRPIADWSIRLCEPDGTAYWARVQRFDGGGGYHCWQVHKGTTEVASGRMDRDKGREVQDVADAVLRAFIVLARGKNTEGVPMEQKTGE